VALEERIARAADCKRPGHDDCCPDAANRRFGYTVEAREMRIGDSPCPDVVDFGAIEPSSGSIRGRDKERRGADQASALVPERIVPSGPAVGSTPVACRLMHPSGWVIECGGLPPAAWMTAVLSGGVHAAT
jgi:hypothetical protein